MTWRITASFHETSFGDSDTTIEALLREQFGRCLPRAPQHMQGTAAAEAILVRLAVSLAVASREVLPGAGAALNGGRVFQFHAQGAGGLIDSIGVISSLEDR